MSKLKKLIQDNNRLVEDICNYKLSLGERMKELPKKIILSTGREIDANHGIIGISLTEYLETYRTDPLNEDGFIVLENTIAEGYDGMLPGREEPLLTPAERKELAGLMVKRWTDWGNGE